VNFPKLTMIDAGPNGQANPVLDDGCFAVLGTMTALETIQTLDATVTDAGRSRSNSCAR